MNTPAHLLLGAAAFGRRGSRHLFGAALVGSLLPDLSLYLLAGAALFIFDISPQRVFDELYFSDSWQTVFAIDNSVFVWTGLLILAFWSRREWAVVLAGAALLHLALDFPLHHDDGRPHFWPVSDWVFSSPLSYWDRARGALWIAPLEAVLALVAALRVWWLGPGWPIGITIGLLLAAQLYVARVWIFVFAV